MSEVRRTEMMNTYEMDSGYPDSVNSSPRSRETDWEAGDTAGGSRFRLMCSYGGKILQRSHDNQLSYVGGDTRILAVDRNIRFAAMNAKLSSLWGPGVSFKYQLPNEELDALVSVTNDEDMENMMAEYERLQKMGYRFSRLRLFVFSNKPDGVSAQGNLGSLMEESKQENWFVDALNVGPVSRPETVQQGNWMNNAPNYSSGLEGIGIKCDRSSSQKSYGADQMSSKEQEIYRGRELQRPEGQSATSSPIDPISASARIITPAASQTEMSINLGHGLEQDSNLAANPKPIDSNRVLKNEDLKNADRTNIQKQEHYTSEFSAVTSSLINERAHTQPQLQVPVQEFQKLQLGQPQDPIARPVDDIANLNKSDMSRPNPKLDQPYMPQQRQYQQIPSQSEYYMHNQGSQFVPQNYWQMQEPHGDQQSAYHPVYFMHAGSPMTTVPSMGQPVPGSGGYYNPGFKDNARVRSTLLVLKFISKMKAMKIIIGLTIVTVALLASISMGKGAVQICNVSKDDLMPCKPAVTQPPAQPVEACCSVLSTANLTCFCEFGNDYPSLLRMFGIDPDLAKALPGECKLDSPPGC